jgi:hypothetical protein
MKLYGVTLDFDDVKSCGMIPELCVGWDSKYEDLAENEKLLSYWTDNIEKLFSKTKNIIFGNIGSKSIVFSADKEAIALISEIFKEIELTSIEYENIIRCENCIKHDYLEK